MKTYKDLKAFEKRVTKSTDWDDYFTMQGKLYKIYEYGGGQHGSPEYVYFVNKRTHDAIEVYYRLNPSYQFISLDFIPNMPLWRTDTL